MILFKLNNNGLIKFKNTPYTEEELAIIYENKSNKVEEVPALMEIYFMTPNEEETASFNSVYNRYIPELNEGESYELIECVITFMTELINKGNIKYYVVSESGDKEEKNISWTKLK